ncbi:MAG: TPM domain-containing protein [Lachnospiraceae bacterium]|nr:TPM domain-containing protein [Lachnospiraceae bacterium]
MKRIRRRITVLTVLLAVMILMPSVLSVHADEPEKPDGSAQSDYPSLYTVSSREMAGTQASGAGSEDSWADDYIALNDDGTGVFLYNEAAFTIRWTYDAPNFSFTDHKGNTFTGTYDNGTITGVYGKYRYVFRFDNSILPVYNLSPGNWGKDLPPVTDQAGVLTESQLAGLTDRAKELSDKYGVGVYVVLVDRRDDYTRTGSIETLSEEIRSGYSIGIGSTEYKEEQVESHNEDWKDSVLLTVAFDCRKYDICISGDYADWAFPKYGREKVRDAFLEDFKGNSWAEGVNDYLDGVEKVLSVASKGHAISFRNDTMGFMVGIVVPLALALLFGYGITALVRSSMQNTQKAQNAATYVAGDKVNFTRREDRYIRTVVSRVYSPREKSSSGGGGGHSSSGSSHTSGSF